MSRRCDLTGKKAMFGNNRSHAMNATRRRFNPNVQKTGLFSDALGANVRLKLSTRAIRTVEKNGGIDAYLMGIADTKLSPVALRAKKRIAKAMARAATA